jgi:transmembrane sensor
MKQLEGKDELLISYLSGSASEKERLEALQYIHASEENRAHFEQLKKYYQLSLLAMPTSEFKKEEAWGRISAGYYKQLYGREKRRNSHQIKIVLRQFALPLAASLLIAFLIGALANYYMFNRSSTHFTYNEIMAPYGSKGMVTLPDSTKVWLNAGSKIKYASNFSGKNREVFLEGEAFFDVIKSEKHLFVVNTSDIRVKVYGTEFNVKAYADEPEIITTLVSGSISIEAINLNILKEPLTLRPNESATFHKAALTDNYEKRIVIEAINSRVVSSWKDGIWVIRGEELGKLAVKLERRFNVNITFEDESLKNYKFSGSLFEETFEQVMKIIKTSAPINFSVENNNVIVREDKLFKERYDSLLQQNQ